jgi:hypothetical protein
MLKTLDRDRPVHCAVSAPVREAELAKRTVTRSRFDPRSDPSEPRSSPSILSDASSPTRLCQGLGRIPLRSARDSSESQEGQTPQRPRRGVDGMRRSRRQEFGVAKASVMRMP